jgi:hypothetical protein
MANIARIFHWTPHAMDEFYPADLMAWHARALARWPKAES